MPGPKQDVVRAAVFCRTEHENGEDKVAPNGESYHHKIRAATNRIARDGGIIETSAWEQDLSRYNSNPVIMFAHFYGAPPVATAVHTEIDHGDGSLVQYVRWLDGLTNDEYDQLAGRLHTLYDVGGMRTWSVGFRIREWRDPSKEEEETAEQAGEEIRWIATRAELLETSAVPVPADPFANTVEQALASAGRKGTDVALIRREWESLKYACPDGSCAINGIPWRIERGPENQVFAVHSDVESVSTHITEDQRDAILNHMRVTEEWQREMGEAVKRIEEMAMSEKQGALSNGLKRGESLARFLNNRIDDLATEERPREVIVEAMAEAAGISVSTVNQILRAEIICPPLERLEGFATALDVSVGSVVSAAENDGCEYDRSDCGCGQRSTLPAVIPFGVHSDYKVAARDTEWDADQEVAAMEASQESLRPRHAFVSDADHDMRSSYKFPHHRANDGMAVVFRALANGFAQLEKADIAEEEKDGIAAHLGRHYRDDFDEDPPERDAVASAVKGYADTVLQDESRSLDWAIEHKDALERLGGGSLDVGVQAVRAALVDETEESVDDGDRELFVIEIDDERDPEEQVVEALMAPFEAMIDKEFDSVIERVRGA